MKKGIFNRWIIFSVAVIACSGLLYLWYTKVYSPGVSKKLHEEVEEYINTELDYDVTKYDMQLDRIRRLMERPHISDEDKGHLYEREAQIHRFRGDTYSFYHTMGNALYYLEKSENRSIAVNIYLDFANYYLAECEYDKTKDMMDKAFEICDPESIEDPQVQSYAYRMCAALAVYENDPERAGEMLDRSDEIIAKNSDRIWHDSYVLINETLRAGIALKKQDFAAARDLLEKNSDPSYFDPPVYADIMTRDFVLPYFDTESKLAAGQGEEERLRQILERVDDYGHRFGFLRKEIRILSDLLEEEYVLSDPMREQIKDRILEVYPQVTDQQADEYATLISSPLENGIREQRQIYERISETRRRIKVAVIEIFGVFLLLLVLFIIILHNLKDPLTDIGNRRALDYYLKLLKIFKKPYFVVMMDVDDFKKVNDTFGHDRGDEVLIRIGKLLGNMQGRTNRAFRFGGEEFVMVTRLQDLEHALRLAENIRRDMQWQRFDFEGRVTISLGVAENRGDKDAVKQADENLYYSKTHGKNAVSYLLENGEQTIFSA